ncbi:MAG: homoserine O-acetyltransferase [Actinomycetia bacterium]|nr:homoserine O-acetyltransferase [Actinomycetes bacterium]
MTTTTTADATTPASAEPRPAGDQPRPDRPYWRLGDPVGHRQFAPTGALDLELGGRLAEATLAYETWGEFTGDNAVLIEHALTGDSHVVGPAGPGHPTAGWWPGLIGPGAPLDTRRWFVVAPNVLGGCQGSTGPSSPAPDGQPYGSRFPALTIRDQVDAEAWLAERLGVGAWAAAIGGSMGGMRALEWAARYPQRVRRVVLLATSATATAEQIAQCAMQLEAIFVDPGWRGGDYHGLGPGPVAGLGLARRLAHLSYRSEEDLTARFGRDAQGDGEPLDGTGRFAVESYFDHHADKLVRRFDAGSYVTLTRSMNSHDIGRGRGGVAAALRAVTARATIVTISSDRLYLPWQQAEIADGIPDARHEVVTSPHGHDGFLIETEQVGAIIRAALAR